jgi:hypothetical protein
LSTKLILKTYSIGGNLIKFSSPDLRPLGPLNYGNLKVLWPSHFPVASHIYEHGGYASCLGHFFPVPPYWARIGRQPSIFPKIKSTNLILEQEKNAWQLEGTNW